jgi:hypothetical protein
MTKKIFLAISIAAVHFVAANWLVPAAMTAATGDGSIPQPAGFIIQAIVLITKILHFPVISYNLYSREWVPGNLIYIPLLINSLLWAAGICIIVKVFQTAWKRWQTRQ